MDSRELEKGYQISNDISLKNKIKSKGNVKAIMSYLQDQLKYKLNTVDLTRFIDFLDELNYSNLYRLYKNDIDKINSYIIMVYKGKIEKNKKPFDMHEFLKTEINNTSNVKGTSEYNFNYIKNGSSQVTTTTTQKQVAPPPVIQQPIFQSQDTSNISNSLLNFSTEKQQIELTKIINYESLWRDSNILIDSRYQNLVNQDKSKMVFTIVNNIRTKIPGTGIITAMGSLRNIVEIEVFPFSIPYLPAADNYYQKLTLSMLELTSICIDAYENSQFHFIFSTKLNGNLIELTPINKIFRFYKPIARLNEFTLRFGSPLNPISFDKDRLNTLLVDYTTNPGEIIFNESHNLITGDLIYITDFTTLDPARDLYVINEINSSLGHICTRLSNVKISINVDFTSIISPDATLSVVVYFGSKRILMPLRIRYLYDTTE
jgi:hypothetical protein